MQRPKAQRTVLICLATFTFLVNRAYPQDQPLTRLPEVTVVEKQLEEELKVGDYQQPEWTTQRRFLTTRAYVLSPWQVEFEQWWKGQWPRGESRNDLFQEELEVGLPHRFQLDLYENWIRQSNGTVRYHDTAVELRYALADWGKLPLNPTLYGEWKFTDRDLGADTYELKLLLAEELAPRWHWAFNAICEQEVGGSRTTEWAASQGISYTLIDQKLSIGVEMKLESETDKGARGPAPIEFDIGPSLQWRPTRNTHVDIVPLFGVTNDSPRAEVFVVFGIDFGRGATNATPAAPRSLQSQ